MLAILEKLTKCENNTRLMRMQLQWVEVAKGAEYRASVQYLIHATSHYNTTRLTGWLTRLDIHQVFSVIFAKSIPKMAMSNLFWSTVIYLWERQFYWRMVSYVREPKSWRSNYFQSQWSSQGTMGWHCHYWHPQTISHIFSGYGIPWKSTQWENNNTDF